MITSNIILKNVVGKSFLLQVNKGASVGHFSNPLVFLDTLSSERFLRSFNQSDSFWYRINNAVYTGYSHQPLHDTARFICQGRIKVFELSHHTHTGDSKAVNINTGHHVRYSFVSAQTVIHTMANVEHFSSPQQARIFLMELQLNREQLTAVYQGLQPAAGTANASEEQMFDKVSTALAQHDIFIVKQIRSPVRAAEPKPEAATEAPGDRVVPLRPETKSDGTDWIEIELVDEDGEPVPNQKYWLKDSTGKEYEGTTDDKGMARLDSVPKGNCDISFPGLDAWR